MNIYVYTYIRGEDQVISPARVRYPTRFPGTITIFPRSVVRETISSFQSLGGSVFLDEKKKKRRKEYRSGRGSVQLRKKYGKRGRENITRFFMVHLILRSIFGVKIFP